MKPLIHSKLPAQAPLGRVTVPAAGSTFARRLAHPGPAVEGYKRPFDPERQLVRPVVILAIVVVAALAFAGAL